MFIIIVYAYVYQVDEQWFDKLHIHILQKSDDRMYLSRFIINNDNNYRICFTFFCIYIDEDQDSPSLQADTAKGRMGYVLCNLNLVKMLPDMLFVTEFCIHETLKLFYSLCVPLFFSLVDVQEKPDSERTKSMILLFLFVLLITLI